MKDLSVCGNETVKLADEICIFLYTAVKDLLKQNFKKLADGFRIFLYTAVKDLLKQNFKASK